MKHFFLSLFVALCGVSFLAVEAQAKRLGGGGSSGMQRQMPAKPTQSSPPAQQAAPGTAAAGAAAAGKRSWLGPIAGLAAGLGLAALMSHLGFGEEFANIIMIALLAVAALVVVRLLLRRFGPAAAPQPGRGLQFAGAPGAAADLRAPVQGSGGGGAPLAPAAAAGPALPAGFDSAAFERIAKLIFIRMQAANDKADLEDLRQFATPEMFAVFKLELQDRGTASQQTDVVQLAAEIVDFAQEDARQIVSVRFHGLIREVQDGAAAPFDELWHLVKPIDGNREWAIAGITQNG